ncbi:hypothetical protein HYS48_01180 [Candidatus Woesearchaeota archaeon]|nr:hypothetical protein [Candidatus Woesearchaeota archaeon]
MAQEDKKQQGLEDIVAHEDTFPVLLRKRIAAVPVDGEEHIVYSGIAAMCEVDMFNSTELVHLLAKKYYVPVRLITSQLKTLRKMVEQHGGYWWQVPGDAVRYIFNTLDAAILCTAEIMQWADRELTEFVKDYAIAGAMLREEGKLSEDPEEQDKQIREKITLLRVLKDIWNNNVPRERKGEKERYEELYAKLDKEIEGLSREIRGRLPTRGGIAHGNLEFTVTKSEYAENGKASIEMDRDPAGPVRYLFTRLTDKGGPLAGQKDRILIAAYDPLPPPQHFTWKELGETWVGNNKFLLYETWGIDHFNHPTFDGRIPDGSPLLKNLEQYRAEVLRERDFLRNLQMKKRDFSIPWLDVTHELREGTDRYKNGRTLMVTALVAGMLDAMHAIHQEYLQMVHSIEEGHLEGFPYLHGFLQDERLTSFMQWLGNNRKTMLLAALTYSNGGAIARANSDTPKYPTRKLYPEANQTRIASERKAAVLSTSDYTELSDLGVPDILAVQDKPISQIKKEDGHERAMQALILRFASRYIHHRSHRPWKLPLQTAEAAMEAADRELSDIIQDGRMQDRYLLLVKDAFLRTLGLHLPPGIYAGA